MSTITCPIDKMNDAIELVSSIAARERVTHGQPAPAEGLARAGLAKVLSAPSAPERSVSESSHWILRFGLRGIGILILLIWLTLTLLRGLFAGNLSLDTLLPSNYEEDPVFMISAMIGCLLAIWLGMRRMKEREADKKRYSSEFSKWEKAMDRWDRLYFCSRHGVVFDPDSGETCEPARIDEFVYQTSRP